MIEGEHLSGPLTMASLAIVDWMITMMDSQEFDSLGECLRSVVIEQSQAGSKNPIIIGLANGMIDLSDPIIHWIMLLLDQRMRSLAEVPLENGSPRGPPKAELIPC
ncbi:hypothetical protein NHH03_15910 [Stieleria sp. TO1_6]|uniref:hypothetical protein n=1 Tax=Stieleria tagensis TaxID=2956795 RepID=UPI00209A8F00|nr:hypothetical protein [Stieleria tagensis]MCO8123234.1 hypothetical protein [Stieleria tagensis]